MPNLRFVFAILRDPRAAFVAADALPMDAWEYRIALHMFVRRGDRDSARLLVDRGIQPLFQTVQLWERHTERTLHAPGTPTPSGAKRKLHV